jgi:DNA-directed RNA polymerase subunit RPC12/RpoP/polyhydroxyalkanoate synthesis regulator phasin
VSNLSQTESVEEPVEALVTQKPKCPLCGAEVDYFIKKKKSAWAQCPACGKKFLVREHPELQPFTRVVEEEGEGRVSEEEGGEVEEKPVRREAPPPSLFEEPKPMEEIIAETLEDWGCDKHFINTVVRYVNRKGYFDPNWLMTLLLQARTGRRFTPQEAWMVVDEIVSQVQREKEKAERLGRQYFGQIIWSYERQGPYPPSQPTYAQQYPTPSYPQPSYTPTPPGYTPLPSYQPPHQQTLSPQQIQEMIQRALAEQRTKSDMEELKKMIYELEKRRIEDRAEVERTLTKFMKATMKTIKETLQNITSVVQQPQQPQPAIDKRDLELMRAELEKSYSQRIQELEKKLVEAKTEAEKRELVSRIEALQKQIEDLRAESGKPISPEGWQRDETRLVAELGTRFLEMLDKRKPMEYLVKVVPYVSKPPKQEVVRTEESVEEIVKAAGGEVE